ncbi:DUF378 domain-containing protein [Haloimpatiens sp. FM7330]|uniref:DUF378 domain-containing protein n=1 Tax=Haloimpatiens sp. FM7330 TaxID=3298610 RepID=UPI003635ABFE
MYKFSLIDKISFILVIIGALNWGLKGLTNIDLVYLLFGGSAVLTRIIYILIGVAGINMLIFLIKSRDMK